MMVWCLCVLRCAADCESGCEWWWWWWSCGDVVDGVLWLGGIVPASCGAVTYCISNESRSTYACIVCVRAENLALSLSINDRNYYAYPASTFLTIRLITIAAKFACNHDTAHCAVQTSIAWSMWCNTRRTHQSSSRTALRVQAYYNSK